MNKTTLEQVYEEGRAVGSGRPYGLWEAFAAISNGVTRMSLYSGGECLGDVEYLGCGKPKAPVSTELSYEDEVKPQKKQVNHILQQTVKAYVTTWLDRDFKGLPSNDLLDGIRTGMKLMSRVRADLLDAACNRIKQEVINRIIRYSESSEDPEDAVVTMSIDDPRDFADTAAIRLSVSGQVIEGEHLENLLSHGLQMFEMQSRDGDFLGMLAKSDHGWRAMRATRMAAKHGQKYQGSNQQKNGWLYWEPTRRYVTPATFKRRTDGDKGSGDQSHEKEAGEQGKVANATLYNNLYEKASELLREKHSHRQLIPIHEIRTEMAKIDREWGKHSVFDKAVQDLRKKGVWRLLASSGTRRHTPQQMEGSIPAGHETMFYVRMKPNAEDALRSFVPEEAGEVAPTQKASEFARALHKQISDGGYDLKEVVAELQKMAAPKKKAKKPAPKASPAVDKAAKKLNALYEVAHKKSVSFGKLDAAVESLAGMSVSDARHTAREFGIALPARASKKKALGEIRRKLHEQKGSADRIEPIGDSGGVDTEDRQIAQVQRTLKEIYDSSIRPETSLEDIEQGVFSALSSLSRPSAIAAAKKFAGDTPVYTKAGAIKLVTRKIVQRKTRKVSTQFS